MFCLTEDISDHRSVAALQAKARAQQYGGMRVSGVAETQTTTWFGSDPKLFGVKDRTTPAHVHVCAAPTVLLSVHLLNISYGCCHLLYKGH